MTPTNLAGLRWLLVRAGWQLLSWSLRAGLRSALGGSGPPANGPPTTPRRAVRSRPRSRPGYSAYSYSSAA